MSKRIVLVMPGRIFRNGIAMVLRGGDRVVIGDFETLDQLEATLGSPISAVAPDLLVIGTAPARASEDFGRIRALRAQLPGARWIVLSRGGGPEFWRDAVESRVDAILHDDSPGEVLQLLVELVLLGYSFLPNGLAKVLAEGLPQMVSMVKIAKPEQRSNNLFSLTELPSVPGVDTVHRWQANLSDREGDILRGLVAGHSNKLIARELLISEATVKVHVKALLRKMQVTNRTQAAISALQFLGNQARLSSPPAGTDADDGDDEDEPSGAGVSRSRGSLAEDGGQKHAEAAD